jgi:hypothetical protein
MAGYLANYGAGEEQREKLIRRLIVGAVVVVIAGGILYFFLKNFRQEQQARNFFQFLEKHDYKAAYTLWGCTDAKPCRDYSFQNFMDDWGPKSPHADVSAFHIKRSRSCGSGVILTVDYGKGQEPDKLWIERGDLTIGFSPWPGCPPGR